MEIQMSLRRIIIIAFILLIGISAIGMAYQSWKEAEEAILKELQEKEIEPFNIEFTFIEQTSFDPEWFYNYMYRTDSPITWWDYAYEQDILDMRENYTISI